MITNCHYHLLQVSNYYEKWHIVKLRTSQTVLPLLTFNQLTMSYYKLFVNQPSGKQFRKQFGEQNQLSCK